MLPLCEWNTEPEPFPGETMEQARARMAEKGADCAAVAVEMANLLRKFVRQ